MLMQLRNYCKKLYAKSKNEKNFQLMCANNINNLTELRPGERVLFFKGLRDGVKRSEFVSYFDTTFVLFCRKHFA